MNNALEQAIRNEWIELGLRWFLGGLFVFASFNKIVSPAEFAKIIYGYDLFPQYAINLIAILYPYLECVTGLFLIAGVHIRAAVLVINALLLSLVIVLSINFARGHQFDCGCFSYGDSGSAGSDYSILIRNIILLAMGGYLWIYKGRRKGRIQRVRHKQVLT